MEAIRVAPTPALRKWSREHGFSPELVARWGEFYGELPEFLRALERPASRFLRINPLRGDVQETWRRLEEKGFRLEESGVPLTLRVLEEPFSAGATEEYLLGRYFLQDASSALAALALEPRRGETIGDFCAAPGGKTVSLAGLTGDDAAIFSFESDAERARGLEANLARCGVTSAAVYRRRAQEAADLGIQFDRILLDAPCTGEGVIPRDPGRRQGQLLEYAECAREQSSLLQAAARLVKPGGVLVYSTCTLAPEENELQVQYAIAELGLVAEPLPASVTRLRLGGNPLRPGLTRLPGRELPPEIALGGHLLPHLHGCLGFYLARLRKEAS